MVVPTEDFQGIGSTGLLKRANECELPQLTEVTLRSELSLADVAASAMRHAAPAELATYSPIQSDGPDC